MPIHHCMRALFLFKILSFGLCSSGTALLSISRFALQMALSKSSCAASCAHQISKQQIGAIWSPSGEDLEKGVDFVKCFDPSPAIASNDDDLFLIAKNTMLVYECTISTAVD